MSTFSYQTPVQFKWKWILYKLTLVSQSGWPLPRVPLNQGGPPCSSPAWPPGPRQGWATGSDRFRLLELRVSRTFLDNLRPQLLRPWIPSSARGKGGGPPRFTAIVLNVSRRRLGEPAGVQPQSPGERNGR